MAASMSDQIDIPAKSLFVGLSLELENIALGMSVLNAKARDLVGCFEHKQAVSAKLTAEDISATAAEISVFAGIIANRISEHVNRQPRVSA